MNSKLISVSIILMFIFTTIISVDAIAPTPKVELDEYQIVTNDKNNVYISGTLNICVGQDVGVFDANGKVMYNSYTVSNTNSKGTFKLQVPSRYISTGKNTFKVKSTPVKNVINGSNSKTLTVTIKDTTKINQTITATNLTLKEGETKSLNASTTSGLPLTFLSENANVATVDPKGNVTGRNKGSTKVVISQAGNNTYNPASKTVTITVTGSAVKPPANEISTSFDAYQFSKIDQTRNLGAKSKSGGALVYKSTNTNIATVDGSGNVKAKKPGTAIIRVSLKSNNACFKNVTIYVPKNPNDRRGALKPWYDAMSAQKIAQNKRPAVYNWGKWHKTGYSLSGSEKYGTCITFPSASLQRAGLLSKGEYVTPQDGKNFNGALKRKSIKFLKRHPGYFTWFNNNTSLKKGVNKGKILPGDIIHYKYHTLVYWGKEKGNLYISEAGRWKSKKYNYAHTKAKTSGKTYVGWVNRINCYNITTTCINGKITDSNLYMAGQNIKVTYSPAAGKKIKSIKVDGKLVSTSNKTNYTFKKLNKNHTIEVVFN